MSKLQTKRLILRLLTIADAAHFQRLLHKDSAAVCMTSSLPDPCTEEAGRDWIEKKVKTGEHTFAVLLKKTGEFIGAVGFGGSQDQPGIGYWIGRPYWGQGYATEAVSILLNHAKSLGIHRLQAETFPNNPSSARVLEKLGFTMTGRVIRDYPLRDGLRELDHHIIELLSDRF
ncbi:MAG: GNAT family N-acetyltransferase [Xenococcaceae cyanobacterium]